MGRRLYVEVLSAHNLMPKDGHGSANPYCLIEFDGQRRRTKVKQRDLNPVWNEKFEFPVSDPMNMGMELLEIWVYTEKKHATGKDSFLGKVRIPGSSFVKHGEEAITHHPLEKKNLLSSVKGELRLKVYYVDDSAGSGKVKDMEKMKDHHHQHHQKDDPSIILKKEEKSHQKDDHGTGKKMMAPAAVLPPDEYALKPTTPALGNVGEKHISYDLVEKMQYLYVRVVKARDLPAKDLTGSDPYVKVKVGQGYPAVTQVIKRTVNPVWNQVFAFGKDKIQGPTLDISVWDADKLTKDEYLGFVQFELSEISKRVPPESPLAPQWYKLEAGRKDASVKGEIMLAVWWGTQADEAFSEAWQSDTGGYHFNRSKVYLSPKLWYLRVNVIEAQDLIPVDKTRYPEVSVRCQLGMLQVMKTRVSSNRTTSPFWNEDMLFVAAEPFEEVLMLTVEDRVSGNKDDNLGVVRIPLKEIDRRIDHRMVQSRWFNLERSSGDKTFRGRLHLRVCFDGGYHVMDESTNHISDTRPTAKQLWKPSLGVLELGILSAKGLLPMKSREGRSTTDAYCVAKYGQKWVRTRTIIDSFNPKWNEQYTWEVHDPCTVLTIGVFDNCHTKDESMDKVSGAKDSKIGKVRIRISTLESDRVYTNLYPLLVLQRAGVKKMGEIELAVRFSCTSVLNMMNVYFRPPLPKMHYLHPLGVIQLEHLRNIAIKIVSARLTRSEPPLRQEVVQYMLDTDSNMWSMRRSKVNYYRMLGVLSGVMAVTRWFNDICQWKNPVTTVLVHVLFLILVWYPELILPTLFLYMFLIGAWHYRFRPRVPPYMNAKLSQAEHVSPDELDEEFDTFPTSKSPEVVKQRYDKLRMVASRIQTVLGDLASQGERLNALLSWRDPRATAIFITFCLVAAILLYVVPFRIVAVMLGIYALRHPRFRNRVPPVPMNFFRRLPSLADTIL